MLLHTVNKSSDSSCALESCLRCALSGSRILLIEDGVYAAVSGTSGAQLLASRTDLHYYVLHDDLQSRGLEARRVAGVETIDYAGFVQLSLECHAVQSWY